MGFRGLRLGLNMRRKSSALACAAFVAVLSGSASADLGSLPFRVDVSSELGVSSFEVSVGDFEYNSALERWSWSLGAPVELRSSSGALVATINSASAYYIADPVVNMTFSVAAGGSATNFSISSALLSFPTINPAEGKATAATTVTDGDGDGATLTGNLGGEAYRAHYNGFLGAGTTFASLADSISAGSHSSNSTNETFGFVGMGAVSDMSSQFNFLLTANDLASGTSHYVVQLVPEPTTFAVLAGAFGLAAARRRRRK